MIFYRSQYDRLNIEYYVLMFIFFYPIFKLKIEYHGEISFLAL